MCAIVLKIDALESPDLRGPSRYPICISASTRNIFTTLWNQIIYEEIWVPVEMVQNLKIMIRFWTISVGTHIFSEMIRLQSVVKNFLVVADIHIGYLEGPRKSWFSNAPIFKTIAHIDEKTLVKNRFLWKNSFIYLFESHFSIVKTQESQVKIS